MTPEEEKERAEIAARIDRHGDRYANAGDKASELEARVAAESVRGAGDIAEARQMERDFNGGQSDIGFRDVIDGHSAGPGDSGDDGGGADDS